MRVALTSYLRINPSDDKFIIIAYYIMVNNDGA